MDEIENIYKSGNLNRVMIPIDQMFEGMGTVIVIPTDEAIKNAINGGKISQELVFAESISSFEDGAKYRLYLPDNRFLGIYSFKDSIFCLEKMFLE